MFFGVREKSIFDAYELYRRRKYDKALAACEEIYAMNMDSYASLNLMGDILLKKGESKRAEQKFLKLTDYFRNTGQFYKAIGILRKLLKYKPDNERYMRLAAEIYRDAGRDGLMVRELFDLAEVFRFEGKFDKCAALYVEISGMFKSNPELDRKIIHKLSVIGHVESIVKIAVRNHYRGTFDETELDDVLILCGESGYLSSDIMRFVPGFISRNRDRMYLIEDIVHRYVKTSFDLDFIEKIVSNAGYAVSENLMRMIKEDYPDIGIVKYVIAARAVDDDRDGVKGLVYELFVNNVMDMNTLEEISLQSSSAMPFEEALKIQADTVDEIDVIPLLRRLGGVYSSLGEKDRADSILVYARYSTVPDNLSKFILSDPEPPEEIESRLDTRTVIKEESIAIQEEIPDSQQVEALASDDGGLELEHFHDGNSESIVDSSVELSDDFELAYDSLGDVQTIKDIETFDIDEPASDFETLDGLEVVYSDYDDENDTLDDDILADLLPDEDDSEEEINIEQLDFSDIDIEEQKSGDILDMEIE